MQIPERTGVMILEAGHVLPQGILPLHIFEPRYRRMLADAIESHRMFCVAVRNPKRRGDSPLPLASLGLIRACVRNADGTSNLVLQGITRVLLGPHEQLRPYRIHPIVPAVPPAAESPDVDVLRSRVVEIVDERLRRGTALHPDFLRQLAKASGSASESLDACMEGLRTMPDAGRLADLIALLMLRDPVLRLQIHLAVEPEERLRKLLRLLGAPGAD